MYGNSINECISRHIQLIDKALQKEVGWPDMIVITHRPQAMTDDSNLVSITQGIPVKSV